MRKGQKIRKHVKDAYKPDIKKKNSPGRIFKFDKKIVH